MGQEITGNVHEAPGAVAGSLLTAAALRAALKARGRTSQKVTIDKLTAESLGTPPTMRQVLHFRGTTRTLSLNVSNTKALANAWGPNASDWKGKTVWLVVVETTYKGESTSGVRIRTEEPS